MKRQIVATEAAPKAIGPYSQAVWAGDFLFCAGQIPLEPATGNIVPGGISERQPGCSITFAGCCNHRAWNSGT